MKKLITLLFAFLFFSLYFSQENIKIGKYEYLKSENFLGNDKSIFLKFKNNSKLAYSGLELADSYKENVQSTKTIIDTKKRKIYYRTILDKTVTQKKVDSVDIVFRQNRKGFFIMSYSIYYFEGTQEKKKIQNSNAFNKNLKN